MAGGKIVPLSGKVFASATERTQSWNGIQQEITGRVQRKLAYEVTAVVRIFGNNVTSSDVRATLWVQRTDQREQYIGIVKFVIFFFFCFHIMIIAVEHSSTHIVPCNIAVLCKHNLQCLNERLVCSEVCRQQTRIGYK